MTSVVAADDEIVWSRSPDAGIKPCETFREATAAKEQGTPRRSRISVNTIAQGTPDRFGCPVVACVRKMHISLHARPRVRPASGVPCALSSSEDAIVAKTRTLSRRGNAESYLMSLRAERSNPSRHLFEAWIASSRSLSSGRAFARTRWLLAMTTWNERARGWL
jgi:hypothetical protein